MEYLQLTLLPELYSSENTVNDYQKMRKHDENQKDSSLVYTYMMFDKKHNKYYVGISIEPYNRYQSYLSGRNANSELLQEISDREEDFKFEIIDSFIDENYTPKTERCRATMIESFLINYYDCIGKGYNKTLRFHHDYEDITFWKSTLTDKLYLLYLSSNHDLLNSRSLEYCSKGTYATPTNTRPRNVEYKKWAIKYLNELEKKGIRIYGYCKKLEGLDRSNMFRLTKKNSYGSIGSERIHRFIRKLENHLELPKRKCPYFND